MVPACYQPGNHLAYVEGDDATVFFLVPSALSFSLFFLPSLSRFTLFRSNCHDRS